MFLGFKGSDTNATKGDSSALTSLSVLDFGLTTPKQHDEEVNTFFVFNVCNAVFYGLSLSVFVIYRYVRWYGHWLNHGLISNLQMALHQYLNI